jgi:hypothetical protein
MEIVKEGGAVLQKLTPLRKRIPYIQRKQIPEIMSGMESHLKLTAEQFRFHAKRAGGFEKFLEFVEARQYSLGFLRGVLDCYGGIPNPPKSLKEELLCKDLLKIIESNGVPYYARDRKELERTYNTLIGRGVSVKSDGKEDIKPDVKKVMGLQKECSNLETLRRRVVQELALRRFELAKLWTATALAELFPRGFLQYKCHQKVMIWRFYKDGRIKCRRKAKIVKLLGGVILNPDNPIYEVCDLKNGEVFLLQQSQINPPGTELTIKGVGAFKAKFNLKISGYSEKKREKA